MGDGVYRQWFWSRSQKQKGWKINGSEYFTLQPVINEYSYNELLQDSVYM